MSPALPTSVYSRPMPKRVLVIGILFCLGGVQAIWGMVAGLMAHHIDINFAVLMLPVGIGLLRGKPNSQWWAGFWIVLGYIGCVLIAVLLLLPAGDGVVSVTWFGKEIVEPWATPCVLGAGVVGVGVLYLLQRLLYSPKARAYFDQRRYPMVSPHAPFRRQGR